MVNSVEPAMFSWSDLGLHSLPRLVPKLRIIKVYESVDLIAAFFLVKECAHYWLTM